MWRKKKVILAALLAGVLLVGGISGVVLAQANNADESTSGAVACQTENTNQTENQTSYDSLLNRVCQIYENNTGVAIDPQQLEEAFAQARREMQDQALKTWLDNLVAQGKISQSQEDEYLTWWQARPENMTVLGPLGGGLGLQGFGGGMRWGRGHCR
jgi:hypothetical protein